ncbi:hypothetical protein SK128_002998 [Halocaridina rubra]|uniref:Uncharacterized protein n=1 Tax=Halocaridina rubra TaxID=373956 RepID=A0AAN8XQI6_HALRR
MSWRVASVLHCRGRVTLAKRPHLTGTVSRFVARGLVGAATASSHLPPDSGTLFLLLSFLVLTTFHPSKSRSITLLVFGTAALLVSAQEQVSRQEARARFRALAEAARNGDKEAQALLKSRRRHRPRQRAEETRSSVVPPRPVFQDAVVSPAEQEPVRVRVPVRRTRVRVPRPIEVTTFRPTTQFSPEPTHAPEQIFLDTEPDFFVTDPVTDAPVFELRPSTVATEPPIFRPVTNRPSVLTQRPRFRPTSQPVDDFSINFDLEPHRALNTGLEIDSRSEHIIPRFGTDRTTEPPVETIRRYSYFDEQGNYVFGYEAADGSFKEEIRGLDCVVNGKYGYVDPDGVRREFTYTSGNRCDPNAVVDPETQEIPALPLNDQFLQQTQEQKLSEQELDQIQFNRKRRPVQTVRPQTQTIVSNSPRRRPQSRPAPRPVEEPQPVFVATTEAPTPVFTTPTSFNRFTTPASFRRAQQGRFPAEVQETKRPEPQPAFAPEEELPQDTRQTTHQAFRPPEGPSFRPTPKPIAFDFDTEFNNLFSNFARPTTRTPVFAPTFRPITLPPPTRPPTTRSPPPPPTTFTPATSAPFTTRRPPLDDGSQTLGGGGELANQLVFDAASGTFKNVPVRTATSHFLPQPAPNPFAPRPSQSPPTFAPRPPTPAFSPQPTQTPRPPPPPPSVAPQTTVGRPLPLPTQPSFNPASHFVINQSGRSPAAAEFDKFFSQFNLKF